MVLVLPTVLPPCWRRSGMPRRRIWQVPASSLARPGTSHPQRDYRPPHDGPTLRPYVCKRALCYQGPPKSRHPMSTDLRSISQNTVIGKPPTGGCEGPQGWQPVSSAIVGAFPQPLISFPLCFPNRPGVSRLHTWHRSQTRLRQLSSFAYALTTATCLQNEAQGKLIFGREFQASS